MRGIAAAALLLAGCDVVLGLRGFDPPPNINHGTVTGTYTWTTVTESATQVPMIATVKPPDDDLDLRARLADGTPLTVTGSVDGYTFELPPGAPYVLETQTKDGTFGTDIPRSTATFALGRTLFDRDDVVGAMQSLPLAFYVTIQGSNPTAGVAIVGSLGVRTFSNLNIGTTLDAGIEWSQVSSRTTKGPLLSGAKHDLIIYERWIDDGTLFRANDLYSTAVELVDHTPIEIGTFVSRVAATPLVFDHCVHLIAPRKSRTSDFETATGLTGAAAGWSIAAYSSLDLPAKFGMQHVATSPNLPLGDDDFDVRFADTVANEHDIAALGIGASRSLSLGSAAPTTLAHGIGAQSVVPPNDAGTCPDVTFLAIPLYLSGTLANRSLTKDGDLVTIERTARVPFTFTVSSDAYDDLIVTLFEVIDVNNTTQLRPVHGYSLVETTMTIDPLDLARNHSYILQVVVRLGYTHAREGDLVHFEFPAGGSTMYTSMFKIAN